MYSEMGCALVEDSIPEIVTSSARSAAVRHGSVFINQCFEDLHILHVSGGQVYAAVGWRHLCRDVLSDTTTTGVRVGSSVFQEE